MCWGRNGTALTGDVVERAGFWLVVLYGVSFTGAIGLLPLAILIAIAEGFKIRSLLSNALAGAALLAFGYYTSGLPHRFEELIDRPPPPISHEGEVAAAAGALFGLTYWLIAGRNAGRWREG